MPSGSTGPQQLCASPRRSLDYLWADSVRTPECIQGILISLMGKADRSEAYLGIHCLVVGLLAREIFGGVCLCCSSLCKVIALVCLAEENCTEATGQGIPQVWLCLQKNGLFVWCLGIISNVH